MKLQYDDQAGVTLVVPDDAVEPERVEIDLDDDEAMVAAGGVVWLDALGEWRGV